MILNLSFIITVLNHQFSLENVNYESFIFLIETVTRSIGSNLSDSKFNFKNFIHVHFDPFFIHSSSILRIYYLNHG